VINKKGPLVTIVALNRVDKGHHGEKWQIKLEDRSALLLMPDGQVAASFTPEEAYPQFDLLNHATSGHNFSITDGQNTWLFTVWPKAFKQIKAFVQQSPEATSETELGKIRRRAIIQTILGSVLFISGIALTLDGYMRAARTLQEYGVSAEYGIFFGAIGIGSIYLIKGFHNFSELRQLRKTAI